MEGLSDPAGDMSMTLLFRAMRCDRYHCQDEIEGQNCLAGDLIGGDLKAEVCGSRG